MTNPLLTGILAERLFLDWSQSCVCLGPIHHGTFLLSFSSLSLLVPTSSSPCWIVLETRPVTLGDLISVEKPAGIFLLVFCLPKLTLLKWWWPDSLVKKRSFDPGVGRPVPKCSQLPSGEVCIHLASAGRQLTWMSCYFLFFKTWILEPRAIIFSAGHWAWSVSPRPPSG